MVPGSTERIRMSVARGAVIHVRTQQRGVDLTLDIADRPTIDSSHGDRVVEELWWRAEQGGGFELQVSALTGRGTVRVDLAVTDPESDLAERFWLARAGLDDLEAGRIESARDKLELAAAGSSPVDWSASALGALAEARRRVGDPASAREALDGAIDRLDGHPASALKARLLLQRGRLARNAGRLDMAAADGREAERHARLALDLYGMALATNFQAFLDDLRGELPVAISGYALAAAQYGQAGARVEQARTRLNQAGCAMKLGTMAEARSIFDTVLASIEGFAAPEARDLRARVDAGLGWWHHLEGEPEAARGRFEASLARRPDHLGTLDRLASTLVALGDFDRARELYGRVEAMVLDQPFWQSHLAINRCRLELEADDLERADPLCRAALAGFERAEAMGSLAETLRLLGRLELRRQNLEAAEAHLARSVETIEAQRRGLSDRAPQFLAERLDSYHLLIQARMALHRRQSRGGWDRRALEIFELTRARRLRDLLALEAGRSNILPPPKIESLHALRGLLDRDTVFVFYHLGEESSVLWWLSKNGLESFDLPPRSQIEPLVHSWFTLLAEPLRNGRWLRGLEARRAARLSHILLDPLASFLEGQRLVFVVDGLLQRLPFGALPAPGEARRPMMVDHEMVSLPSASVLGLLRRMTDERRVAPGQIAMIVDPVYDPRDERLAAPWRGRPATEGALRSAGSVYPRLVNTGLEAQAILELMPDGERLLLEGFQASLSRVVSGELADYRIVHFATHAETGDRRPFGLVLSQVAEDGRALDGRLGLEELYGMELPGEMAVLSACGTGLGTDLEGEGLISLTRGFMHAGTPRVLISLWSVEDRASRQFMERFYGALTENCLCPSAALQKAQVESWRTGQAKHRWAPFVLQGDWRRFPLCAGT